ncbi:MAG: hypothetical protein IPJ65_22145 [Archangiaceae bacterium]|nr:hypothetical protein [Archangiaceae bacterium]
MKKPSLNVDRAVHAGAEKLRTLLDSQRAKQAPATAPAADAEKTEATEHAQTQARSVFGKAAAVVAHVRDQAAALAGGTTPLASQAPAGDAQHVVGDVAPRRGSTVSLEKQLAKIPPADLEAYSAIGLSRAETARAAALQVSPKTMEALLTPPLPGRDFSFGRRPPPLNRPGDILQAAEQGVPEQAMLGFHAVNLPATQYANAQRAGFTPETIAPYARHLGDVADISVLREAGLSAEDAAYVSASGQPAAVVVEAARLGVSPRAFADAVRTPGYSATVVLDLSRRYDPRLFEANYRPPASLPPGELEQLLDAKVIDFGSPNSSVLEAFELRRLGLSTADVVKVLQAGGSVERLRGALANGLSSAAYVELAQADAKIDPRLARLSTDVGELVRLSETGLPLNDLERAARLGFSVEQTVNLARLKVDPHTVQTRFFDRGFSAEETFAALEGGALTAHGQPAPTASSEVMQGALSREAVAIRAGTEMPKHQAALFASAGYSPEESRTAWRAGLLGGQAFVYSKLRVNSAVATELARSRVDPLVAYDLAAAGVPAASLGEAVALGLTREKLAGYQRRGFMPLAAIELARAGISERDADRDFSVEDNKRAQAAGSAPTEVAYFMKSGKLTFEQAAAVLEAGGKGGSYSLARAHATGRWSFEDVLALAESPMQRQPGVLSKLIDAGFNLEQINRSATLVHDERALSAVLNSGYAPDEQLLLLEAGIASRGSSLQFPGDLKREGLSAQHLVELNSLGASSREVFAALRRGDTIEQILEQLRSRKASAAPSTEWLTELRSRSPVTLDEMRRAFARGVGTTEVGYLMQRGMPADLALMVHFTLGADVGRQLADAHFAGRVTIQEVAKLTQGRFAQNPPALAKLLAGGLNGEELVQLDVFPNRSPGEA